MPLSNTVPLQAEFIINIIGADEPGEVMAQIQYVDKNGNITYQTVPNYFSVEALPEITGISANTNEAKVGDTVVWTFTVENIYSPVSLEVDINTSSGIEVSDSESIIDINANGEYKYVTTIRKASIDGIAEFVLSVPNHNIIDSSINVKAEAATNSIVDNSDAIANLLSNLSKDYRLHQRVSDRKIFSGFN